MTQQYVAGELSLRLGQLQAVATPEERAREVARLRYDAERLPRAELGSVVVRALGLADRLCWDSLECGDALAFSREAAICKYFCSEALDRIVDELLGVMNGSLLREEVISLRGNPGRVVSYRVRDRPGLVEEVRIILVERRLYLVEVGRNELAGAARPNGSARRFFDSFELIEP